MGLFWKKEIVGELKIVFLNEKEANVDYVTAMHNENDINSDLMTIMTLYYAKILFNLGKGKCADQLIEDIENIVQSLLDSKGQINSILPENLKINKSKPTREFKRYTAEFYFNKYGSPSVETHMSPGNENYFAPKSVLALFQFIKDRDDTAFPLLLVMLKEMNIYYKRVCNYSEFKSIKAAPEYAVRGAENFMSSYK